MKLVFLLMFFVVDVYARPTPPAPTVVPGISPAPGPPGGPIDDHIIILLIIALLYGLYIVYSRRKLIKP